MKRYKVIEVVRLLKQDGWELVTISGDHRAVQASDKTWKGDRKRKRQRGAEPISPKQHLEAGRLEMIAL